MSIDLPGDAPDARTASPFGYAVRRQPVVHAGDLWFGYRSDLPVVRGVTLDVYSGAVTMILGRSGSGKTTLLKVLKGLLHPQRGSVQIAARCSNGRAAGAIAYVPQTLGLVRSLTALDNVLTGALSRVGTVRSLAHIFPGAIVDEARETIARLGLGHKLHEPVYRLSGGERQRVAIARALMQHPDLILADEFVSQLDPITACDILDMMRDISHNRGVSLLVTTHETDVVEDYADRVVVMRHGEIVHDSPGGRLSQPQMLDLLR
ncbi:MAG: ATP-binding cassette domain-containing protein [Dehalococcoidia bacterium]|nr:ATP-binding cassette domain-containing protein [Dehalococcoidia bacterium]